MTIQNKSIVKKRLCEIPFTAKTIVQVLPKLVGEDFDNYMLEVGPQAWKDAITSGTLSNEVAKRLILMVLSRPALLQSLSVYLSLWERDLTASVPKHQQQQQQQQQHQQQQLQPAIHLYELGLEIW